MNQNEAAILAAVPGATAHVPLQLKGSAFLAGSVFNDLIEWSRPGHRQSRGAVPAVAQHLQRVPRPGDQHDVPEVSPRNPGQEAFLSPFLTGTTVFDFFTGQTRTFNDLSRRQTDLTTLVCPPAPPPGGPVVIAIP